MVLGGQWGCILRGAKTAETPVRKQSEQAASDAAWKARLQRVSTLQVSGEKGRALAGLTAHDEKPQGLATRGRLRELFPANTDPSPVPQLNQDDTGTIALAAGEKRSRR